VLTGQTYDEHRNDVSGDAPEKSPPTNRDVAGVVAAQ
jgi:hypothetical protein